MAIKVVVMSVMVAFVAPKVARLLVIIVKVHFWQDVAECDVCQSARSEKQNEADPPVQLILSSRVVDRCLFLQSKDYKCDESSERTSQ